MWKRALPTTKKPGAYEINCQFVGWRVACFHLIETFERKKIIWDLTNSKFLKKTNTISTYETFCMRSQIWNGI